MSFINTTYGVGRGILRQLFWEAPRELTSTLYANGPVQIANHLAKDEGAEKVYKVATWALPLLSDRFNNMNRALKQTLDVCYGTMIVKNVSDSFISYDPITEQYSFRLPAKDRLVSTVLLTMGSVAEFFYFSMYTLDLFQIQKFSDISKELGQHRLFQHQPFAGIRVRPKDFFNFFGFGASIIEVLYKNYQNYKNPNNSVYRNFQAEPDHENKPAFWIRDTFSAQNLLKHGGSIGKMTLYYYGPTHHSQPWYIIAAGVTNVASLLATCVK